ncbi:MAG: O-succinylhomoserine sulfhydrylase [Alphaproteobacteria bacterium GM7ARS4]|nr:O-succinylhomoserine sulfhydrylase [Alphaproteobacteria bacterium GM7ARS4]
MTEKARSAQGGRATRAVHSGQLRSGFMETSEALYMTSGYVYKNAQEAEAAFKDEKERYIYSRYSNPTVTMFEQKMVAYHQGAAQGGHHVPEGCWATASGMAAVFAALMCQLREGSRVVASRALFGSCLYIITDILPRFGVEIALVDGRDKKAWERALGKKTDVVFIETPSNPTLEIIDMAWLCACAHRCGANVIVDNVFATACLQNPFLFGVDIVVYSATKHIDGHGRCMGGAILGSKDFCNKMVKPFIRNTGPSMSPFSAWVMVKGLETLDMRVRHQSASALTIARFLEDAPQTERVFYPYLESHPDHALAKTQMEAGGTMISFTLRHGGRRHAFAFLDALRLFLISNNLGDTRSLAVHPSTTTHHRLTEEERSQVGITDNLVRLSIGLEETDDLMQDIAQAWEKAV